MRPGEVTKLYPQKIVNNSIGGYQKEKKHDDGPNVEISVEAIFTSKFIGFVISIPTAQL